MTIPSDSAIAQAFREHRKQENEMPSCFLDAKLVKFGDSIVRRAREIDASRGGADECMHSAIAPNMNRCIKCGRTWDGDKWAKPQSAAAGELPEAVGVPCILFPMPNDEEMQALRSFAETAEDDESYHVPKEMMMRLSMLGAVTRGSRPGWFWLTDFGRVLIHGDPVDSPAVAECRRDAAFTPETLSVLRDAFKAADWPSDETFTWRDEFGEHDPCYAYMPDGGGIAFNHHAVNGVDQARAEFVAAACNAALRAIGASMQEAGR